MSSQPRQYALGHIDSALALREIRCGLRHINIEHVHPRRGTGSRRLEMLDGGESTIVGRAEIGAWKRIPGK
jgi:hypothetical protein